MIWSPFPTSPGLYWVRQPHGEWMAKVYATEAGLLASSRSTVGGVSSLSLPRQLRDALWYGPLS